MHEDLIKRLREEASSWCINCCYRAGDCICAAPDDRKKDCDICSQLQAADAIEAQDRHILTLQHEMMAEAESHTAIVERLSKQNKKLEEALKTALDFIPCWIPVTERLPKEKINPNTRDFEYVLCTTIWGDVRPFKYGAPIGSTESHFWNGAGYVDAYVTHWMPLPEPLKEETE